MGRSVRHKGGKGQPPTAVPTSRNDLAEMNGIRPEMLRHHQQRRDGARLFGRNLQRSSGSLRQILLAIVCGYLIQKNIKKYVLPYGPAMSHPPTQHADLHGIENDLLQLHHNRTQKIYASTGIPLKGPETVVFGNDGSMYILSEDANLVHISNFQDSEDGVTINATASIVADLGIGRPLGGRFTTRGNTLYIGDAILGLTRIRDVKDKKSKLEIVAGTVRDRDGVVSPILYADDVTVGPKTGRVYFTDSTDYAPHRKYSFHVWDTLYASKMDLARGKGKGRLLQYDPHTDTTTILAQDLKFANGIAVDKDESYLIVAETFGVNLLKYNLANGTMETLIGSRDLPGYLDGVDCSWTTGLCYAVMPSAIVAIHKFWNYLPIKGSQLFRTMLLLMPSWLMPAVKKFGGLVEVDPITKEFRFILDASGKDVSMLTGVTVYKNKLYLGSLKNKYIGVYNL
jgi:Strictosidine synthase